MRKNAYNDIKNIINIKIANIIFNTNFKLKDVDILIIDFEI